MHLSLPNPCVAQAVAVNRCFPLPYDEISLLSLVLFCIDALL